MALQQVNWKTPITLPSSNYELSIEGPTESGIRISSKLLHQNTRIDNS